MSAEFFYVCLAIIFGFAAGIFVSSDEKQIAGIGVPVLFMAVFCAFIGVRGYSKMGHGNPVSAGNVKREIYLFSGQVITTKGVVVIIEDIDQNVLAVWQETESLPLPENTRFVKISNDENQARLVLADIADKEDSTTSVTKEMSEEE